MDISQPEKLELSYEEYWISRTEWGLAFAINLFVDHALKLRKWRYYERYGDVKDEMTNKCTKLAKLYFDASNLIKAEVTYPDPGDEDPALDVAKCTVAPACFVAFADKYTLEIPERLKHLLPDYKPEKRIGGLGANASAEKMHGEPEEAIDLDEQLLQDIDKADVPWLKKKVKELFNEKDKWDKSIVTAARIGLLFYESQLSKPATEAAFVAEFNKHFGGLPKKTIIKIYKALPSSYRNKGGSPEKEVVGISDETIDLIIEASTHAGFLTHKEGLDFLEEVEERLTEDEYEIPTTTFLVAIKKGCKKVYRKYT